MHLLNWRENKQYEFRFSFKPDIKVHKSQAAGPILPSVVSCRSFLTPGLLFPGLVPIETNENLAGSKKALRASSDCSGPSNAQPFSDPCAGSTGRGGAQLPPSVFSLSLLSCPPPPPAPPPQRTAFPRNNTHTHTWHSEIGMFTMDTRLPFPLRQRLLGISNYP